MSVAELSYKKKIIAHKMPSCSTASVVSAVKHSRREDQDAIQQGNMACNSPSQISCPHPKMRPFSSNITTMSSVNPSTTQHAKEKRDILSSHFGHIGWTASVSSSSASSMAFARSRNSRLTCVHDVSTYQAIPTSMHDDVP